MIFPGMQSGQSLTKDIYLLKLGFSNPSILFTITLESELWVRCYIWPQLRDKTGFYLLLSLPQFVSAACTSQYSYET